MEPLVRERDVVQEILEALSGTSGLDRNEIAAAMGKARLNPSEVKHLEELVSNGQVERIEELRGITKKYIYRKQ